MYNFEIVCWRWLNSYRIADFQREVVGNCAVTEVYGGVGYFGVILEMQENFKLARSIKEVYTEINNNWSVEAKKEKVEYFYNTQEINDIKDGKKSFVIGRKGCGKTAIAKNLINLVESDIFADKLSFQNFPFNILYSLENEKAYTKPNQYISIWKYLIYSVVCKQMIKNSSVDEHVKHKLVDIYGNDSLKQLNRMVERWTATKFSAQISMVGLGGEREKTKASLTWVEAIDVLESIIIDYGGDSKYFIVFDELDEDYRDFSSDLEAQNYKDMLTSLFKATQDIRSIFDDNNQKVFPIVFLRSDIYSQIQHSDKNKWRESVINLKWTSESIKKLLAHRLCIASHQKGKNFEEVFYQIFSREMVRMGNKQSREMKIFDYIERSTEMRPRDFIQYIIECVKIALERSTVPITPKIVRGADEEFSLYLKAETLDELYPIIHDVEEIIGLLSIIRKQTFKFDSFAEAYREYKKVTVKDQEIIDVLLKFFEAGVIGNQPSMRGKAVFTFDKEMPRFNYKELIRVHRGLYKALQIY